MKTLHIWLFWLNAVTKECFLIHTTRVAHVVREHIPDWLSMSYLQYVNEVLKMRIETLTSFPQEAFQQNWMNHSKLTLCLLHVIFPVRTEPQTNNDLVEFACYPSLFTDTCPNKLLPMDYLKCKAIICTKLYVTDHSSHKLFRC